MALECNLCPLIRCVDTPKGRERYLKATGERFMDDLGIPIDDR